MGVALVCRGGDQFSQFFGSFPALFPGYDRRLHAMNWQWSRMTWCSSSVSVAKRLMATMGVR